MTTTISSASAPATATALRVLTGDRPTGPLHVGHYFGTLENRVRLQALGAELFVLIADYQTITDREAPATLPADVEGLIADYLAVGIDPARSVIFTHSQIPELNQLMLPFSSLVSVAELKRNPTVKDEIAVAGGGSTSGLMFTYPNGRKMGKSRGNAIPLAAGDDEITCLIRSAKTDGERRITYEPKRRPEVSNLVLLAALCRGRRPQEIADEIGDRGASALKDVVTDALIERLGPIRARRAALATDRAYLRSILRDGNARARAVASSTLDAVHNLMHTTL